MTRMVPLTDYLHDEMLSKVRSLTLESSDRSRVGDDAWGKWWRHTCGIKNRMTLSRSPPNKHGWDFATPTEGPMTGPIGFTFFHNVRVRALNRIVDCSLQSKHERKNTLGLGTLPFTRACAHGKDPVPM